MTPPEVTLTPSGELAAENEWLRAELRARVDELRAWRGRLVGAIEAERRRLERDLHDGAQGRLVAAAMSLGFLEAKLASDPHAAKPIVREARQAVAAALAQVRDLSQGIYPTVLTERGLGAALAELCDCVALPVELKVGFDRRPGTEVEAVGYFVVSEALTNAAKHAHATQVCVTARDWDHQVVLEVCDDGVGGAAASAGSGLRGMADRVEDLGGRLTVSSSPGRGTTIRAEIPSQGVIRSSAE